VQTYPSFITSFYSEEQFNINKKESGTNRLHFDATGTLVPSVEGKRVFLYSLVAPTNSPNVPCLPVLEFLSNSHSAQTISEVLFGWRLIYEKICGRPTTVVTDFSFALTNSVAMAFNNFTIAEQLCHQWECLKKGQKPEFLVIQLCVSHFMKSICQKFSKITMPKNVEILNQNS